MIVCWRLCCGCASHTTATHHSLDVQQCHTSLVIWLQDLQKMAHDANAVVEGKLQQQLAAAQEKLLSEQQRRVDAEGEVKVRVASGCAAHSLV